MSSTGYPRVELVFPDTPVSCSRVCLRNLVLTCIVTQKSEVKFYFKPFIDDGDASRQNADIGGENCALSNHKIC